MPSHTQHNHHHNHRIMLPRSIWLTICLTNATLLFLLLGLCALCTESTYVPQLTSSSYNFYRRSRSDNSNVPSSSSLISSFSGPSGPSALPTTLALGNGNSDYQPYASENTRPKFIQLTQQQQQQQFYPSYPQSQNVYSGPSSRMAQLSSSSSSSSLTPSSSSSSTSATSEGSQYGSQPQSSQTYFTTSAAIPTEFIAWPQRQQQYYSTGVYLTPALMMPSPSHSFAKRLDQPQQIVGSTSFTPLYPISGPSQPCRGQQQGQQQAHNIASEHYPVYVLPPKNFQPIIYHQSGPSGVLPSYITRFAPPTATVYYHHSHHPQTQTQQRPSSSSAPSEESWYESPQSPGDLSTLPVVKPEPATRNQIHYEPELNQKKSNPNNNKNQVIYISGSDNFGSQSQDGSSFPVLEAISTGGGATTKTKRQEEAPQQQQQQQQQQPEPETKNSESGSKKKKSVGPSLNGNRIRTIGANPTKGTNPYNSFVSKAQDVATKGVATKSSSAPNHSTKSTKESHKKVIRPYRTKLPVGLTSFFLGGMRGVTGRHWNFSEELVKKVEFMPNISPIREEDEKYYPEVEDPIVLDPENDQAEKEEPDSGAGPSEESRQPENNNNNSINNESDREIPSLGTQAPVTPSNDGKRPSPLKLRTKSTTKQTTTEAEHS